MYCGVINSPIKLFTSIVGCDCTEEVKHKLKNVVLLSITIEGACQDVEQSVDLNDISVETLAKKEAGQMAHS